MELTPTAKRQAHDTISGFGYQFWRSVYAWTQLKEGELLWIEGAEDFDITSEDFGLAVQTKRLATPLTLRTESVTEAIKNALEMFKAHSDKSVYYRFVSTAEATIERGSPFGPEIKGLNLWKDAAKNVSSATAIIKFLIAEGAITSWAIGILKEKGEVDAWNNIFSKISFDLGAEDTPQVLLLIEEALVLIGEKFGVAASASKKVAPALLSEVISCASTRGSPPLPRAKLLEIFEAQTHSVVPISSIAAAIRSEMARQGLQTARTPVTDLGELSDASSFPTLPSIYLNRSNLVNAVHQMLGTYNFACVCGSSGVGKSTIAQLVASSFRGALRWLHVSQLLQDTILSKVAQAVTEITGRGNRTLLVIDDINLSSAEVTGMSSFIRAILGELARTNSALLVTMQRPASGGWTADHPIDKLTLHIPMLTEDEIAEFLLRLGCPQEDVSRIALILHLQTSGHMQLVHARLKTLKSSQWKTVSSSELLDSTADITQTKREARLLLAAASAEPARKLIYRLSAWGSMFKRDHILYIARVVPQIELAGDVFEELVGPWIEAVSSRRYRLSPLLQSAAYDVWTQEEIAALQCDMANAMLQSESLSLTEFSQILLIGLTSSKLDLVYSVVFAVASIKPQYRREFASAFFWLPRFRSKRSRIVPSDEFLNCQIRLLQAQVARENSDPHSESFIYSALSELSPTGSSESSDLNRFMLLGEVLMAGAPTQSAQMLLQHISDFISTWQVASTSPILASLSDIDLGKVWGQGPIGVYDLPAFALVHLTSDRSPEWYSELADLFPKNAELLQAIFDTLYRRCPFFGNTFVDKIWLSEEENKDPQWNRAIATLTVIRDFSLQWSNYLLYEATVRAIAIVLDEYMGSRVDALALVQAAIKAIPTASHRIKDALATLLAHSDLQEDALDVWLSIKDRLTVDPVTRDTTSLFALQRAAECAGDLGRWNTAKQFLNQGIVGARVARDIRLQVGFMADLGVAHWYLHEYAQCVTQLQTALNRLQRLPSNKEDPRTFKLWKAVSHVVLYIENYFDGDSPAQLAVPRGGMCSRVDTPEGLLKLPNPVPSVTIQLAGAVEWKYTGGFSIWEKYSNRLKDSQTPAVHLIWPYTSFAHNLKQFKYTSLLGDAATLARTVASLKARHNVAPTEAADFLLSEQNKGWRDSPVDGDSLRAFMMNACWAALIDGAARKRLLGKILEQYASYSGTNQDEVTAWAKSGLSYIQTYEARDAFHMLKESTCNSAEQQTFAAIAVLYSAELHPSMALYSQALIFSHLKENAFHSTVAPSFGKCVESIWRGIVCTPSLLRTPKFSVPTILNACDKKPISLRSAASILLAGHNATNIRIPDGIMKQLNQTKLP